MQEEEDSYLKENGNKGHFISYKSQNRNLNINICPHMSAIIQTGYLILSVIPKK